MLGAREHIQGYESSSDTSPDIGAAFLAKIPTEEWVESLWKLAFLGRQKQNNNFSERALNFTRINDLPGEHSLK